MKIVLPIYHTITRKTKSDKKFLVGLNWYLNSFHHERNMVKHYFHTLVENQVTNEVFDKCTIHYDIYTKKITDGGNVRSTIEKFVLDGLKQVGVIKDDNVTVVVGDSARYYAVKDNFRCEITIKGE